MDVYTHRKDDAINQRKQNSANNSSLFIAASSTYPPPLTCTHRLLSINKSCPAESHPTYMYQRVTRFTSGFLKGDIDMSPRDHPEYRVNKYK